MDQLYDVIILGGGAAATSAALPLQAAESPSAADLLRESAA